MNEPVQVYSISSRYLWNLWQQATFGGLGILVSWAAFLAISLPFQPALPADELWRLPVRLLTDSRLWAMPTVEEIRELIRFGIGPGLAFCAVLGGLADFSSWVAVRYEVWPDKLRMCWRRLTREVSWDLIHTIDERPHPDGTRRSLLITQNEAGTILVRGLDAMSQFVDLAHARAPQKARWTISPARVDLTSRAVNFAIGFLLLIPFSATWMAYYVVQSTSIALFWSLILLVAAFWIWYRRPLSRPHMCVREVEVGMAALILLLSCIMTFLGWNDSPVHMAVLQTLGL